MSFFALIVRSIVRCLPPLLQAACALVSSALRGRHRPRRDDRRHRATRIQSCLSVCLSVCLSACLSVCLSVIVPWVALGRGLNPKCRLARPPGAACVNARSCRQTVSATPLHDRRSIQVKFRATAQHRAARTADSREHRHRSTAKASSQPLRPTPLRKPTRLLRAALAAVAADCSTHSPRFAQVLLAGWLSPRAADCTSSGDLASHWTRQSSGETPAR